MLLFFLILGVVVLPAIATGISCFVLCKWFKLQKLFKQNDIKI